ncbi:S24/S26 family peptidase [Arthrobacter luteolus]|uniref:S24/S26 family peptidase n=1 Tax=Arthrobacter luteolus TaxID=98672 RepID=UPI000AE28BD3|nr:S24/S26 family peptidase [Arthrobacter luteolus]
MPRARRLRSWFTGAVLAAFVAGLLYFLWPSSLGGCSTLTIVSGHSMDPTYATGDLVWSRCGEPSVGDIVVYSPADTNGAQVIHRIVGGDAESGWILQGDNNDFLDPWKPDNSQIVGIAAVHIPQLGNILYSFGNPGVWGSLLILAAAFFLWPQSGEEEAAEASEGPDSAASQDSAAGQDHEASQDHEARPESDAAPGTEKLPALSLPASNLPTS